MNAGIIYLEQISSRTIRVLKGSGFTWPDTLLLTRVFWSWYSLSVYAVSSFGTHVSHVPNKHFPLWANCFQPWLWATTAVSLLEYHNSIYGQLGMKAIHKHKVALLKLCALHYLMGIHNRTIYTWQQLLVITVSKENLLYNTIVVIVAPFNCGPPVIAFLPPSDHYVGCCPFHWLLMYTFIGILEKHDTIGRSYRIWSTILLYPSLGGGRFTRSPTPMCKTAPQGGIHNLLLRQHQCRYGQHS